MTNRLLIGAAPQGVRGGALMVRDRARWLVAPLEVFGELSRDRLGPARPCGFEPVTDARVARRTAGGRQAVRLI